LKLKINGKHHEVDADPEETLLQVLMDHLNLLGSLHSSGQGECGSCIVLINGKAHNACQITVGSLNGDRIRTIEGIPENHPVKEAWRFENVPECSYCKSGQIMKAVALLSRMLNPSEEDIREALNTDQCTCGENPQIIRAINRASKYSYDS